MNAHATLAKKSVTILLPAGRLPLNLLRVVDDLVGRLDLTLYLTTLQNVRVMGIPADKLDEVKAELARGGATFKGPGLFPLPRICIGSADCKLGLVDTAALSHRIMERFGNRTNVKPKFKIALAGCPASCSGALLTDIGVLATRAGYDIYAGGKGGAQPRVGRRIVRQADEKRVLEVIAQLADFHAAKTGTKQRMGKLLDDPDFPFAAAV